MVKTDKLCARCGKNIIQIRDNPIANHTNIEHPGDVHYFCGRECKLIWLAERMENREDEKTFKCAYCGKGFNTDRGKWTHEGRCKDNPKVAVLNKEPYVPDGDNYTIEDLRKIDRILGLTDGQIAKFVRGSGSGSNKQLN